MGRGEVSWRCARFGRGSRHDKRRGLTDKSVNSQLLIVKSVRKMGIIRYRSTERKEGGYVCMRLNSHWRKCQFGGCTREELSNDCTDQVS